MRAGDGCESAAYIGPTAAANTNAAKDALITNRFIGPLCAWIGEIVSTLANDPSAPTLAWYRHVRRKAQAESMSGMAAPNSRLRLMCLDVPGRKLDRGFRER